MAIAAVAGQVAEAANGGAGTTLVAVLPNNPATGNTVALAFQFYNGGGGGASVANITVLDAAANAYTISTNSPSTYHLATGQIFLAYLVNAPSNANKTITVTITTANWALGDLGYIWAKEFTPTSGTMAFDADAKAISDGSSATVNTPSVPVNGTGEMIYAVTAIENTINSVDSPFTSVGTVPTSLGSAAEYVLGRSAATAVAYTESSSGIWSGMGMSFSFTASGGPSPSVNEAVSVVESVSMKMNLGKVNITTESVAVTESLTMHMPIAVRMYKP